MKQRLRTLTTGFPDKPDLTVVEVVRLSGMTIPNKVRARPLPRIFAIGPALAYQVSVACLSECDMDFASLSDPAVRSGKAMENSARF
ncbi:MAG: hypothetical protein Tsb0019_28370 [Roseibium sp.]